MSEKHFARGLVGNIAEVEVRKENIQHVYGAQHPPFDPLLHTNLLKANSKLHLASLRTKKVTTFQEFESITSDAWDVGDDDDLLAMAAQNLNTDVVMETANKVIQRHSKSQEQKQLDKPVEANQEQLNNLEKTGSHVENIVKSNSGCEHDASTGLNLLEKTSSQGQSPVPSTSPTPLAARIAEQDPSQGPLMTEREITRLEKFRQLLAGPNTDLEELRKLSWSGIPRQVRPITWKLLSGYLPANVERRESTLQRKRAEYFAFIEQYYDSRNDEHHQDTYRQIAIDIPRMTPESLILQPKVREIHIDISRANPLIPLFQQASVQKIFERILFIWAIRHPASGYVQGINDLVTPFFVVFVFEYIGPNQASLGSARVQALKAVATGRSALALWKGRPVPVTRGSRSPGAVRSLPCPSRRQEITGLKGEVENFDVSSLPDEVLQNIEADSFWCMSKLLDGIQDNYTFAQPGIQRKVKALHELVRRIDEQVHKHLQQSEVEYLQFAFRWMNNLLMRELPLRCTIRLWDTYQSEPEGFSHFHLYVCAAFLVRWRKELMEEKDFQERGATRLAPPGSGTAATPPPSDSSKQTPSATHLRTLTCAF
ncbi:TBC1 domain family member 22A isoform X4 [Narcine bancroftii]|uniref:TBC1 domain family member 22A isoform X4 n=1 Tax=Narcine bancroftii TaxID=1343680 RepID=UPI003831DBB2